MAVRCVAVRRGWWGDDRTDDKAAIHPGSIGIPRECIARIHGHAAWPGTSAVLRAANSDAVVVRLSVERRGSNDDRSLRSHCTLLAIAVVVGAISDAIAGGT